MQKVSLSLSEIILSNPPVEYKREEKSISVWGWKGESEDGSRE